MKCHGAGEGSRTNHSKATPKAISRVFLFATIHIPIHIYLSLGLFVGAFPLY